MNRRTLIKAVVAAVAAPVVPVQAETYDQWAQRMTDKLECLRQLGDFTNVHLPGEGPSKVSFPPVIWKDVEGLLVPSLCMQQLLFSLNAVPFESNDKLFEDFALEVLAQFNVVDAERTWVDLHFRPNADGPYWVAAIKTYGLHKNRPDFTPTHSSNCA